MNKNVPNLLSILRIILSILLIGTKPFSTLFFILYILCGMSDVLDGFLARKFNITSELGAILDSWADFIMIFVFLYLILPVLNVSIYFIVWIVVIVGIRFGSLLVTFIKYHKLAFLHTYANKITGFLLFCFPVFYVLLGMSESIFLLCLIATISAIEELLIHIKAKKIDRNVKSIFLSK